MSSLPSREALAAKVERELGPFAPRHLAALRRVSRSPFVRPCDEARSDEDIPLPLDSSGLATVSAPHAYLLSFRLVELSPGDHVLELGTGSGFGAALAAEIVGPSGFVVSLEIDPALAEEARRKLASWTQVATVCGDAMASWHTLPIATKVICTFSVDVIPESWCRTLPAKGVLVAPVGPAGGLQRLVRAARREDGSIEFTDHGSVRYVANRSPLRGERGDGP